VAFEALAHFESNERIDQEIYSNQPGDTDILHSWAE
jgi:hypothetical protein